MPPHLLVILLLFAIPVIYGEYRIIPGYIPSYLAATDNTWQLSTSTISINVSLTQDFGLLLGVTDFPDKLTIMLTSESKGSLNVTFNNAEENISLHNLCDCSPCKYVPLLFSISINVGTMLIRCNNRPGRKIRYVDRSHLKQKTSGGVSLWLVNAPEEEKSIYHPLQIEGCIFQVKFNGRSLENMKIYGNAISTGCPPVCKTNTCKGGICRETYGKAPLCDCSRTFGSGPNCEDESTRINKKYNQEFQLAKVKLSWMSDEPLIWEMRNSNTALTVKEENGNLFVFQTYSNSDSVERDLLMLNYKHNTSQILIMTFSNRITFQLNGHDVNTRFSGKKDLSEEVFEQVILSSGTGVIDMAYRSDNELMPWKKLYLLEDKSEPLVTPIKLVKGNVHGKSVLVYILPVVVILIILIAAGISIICICRRKNNSNNNPCDPENRKNDNTTTNKNNKTYEMKEQSQPLINDCDKTMPSNTNNQIGELESIAYPELTNVTDPFPVELQILHWETYSMVCAIGNHEVDRIIESLKQSVSPINRPIIICCIEDPLSKLPLDFHYKPLHIEGITFQEFLVHSRRQNVEEILNKVRDWKLSDLKYDDGVSFDVKVSPVTDRWKYSRHVVVKYQLEGSDDISEIVDIFIAKDVKIKEIKIVFMEYLRFFYVSSIMTAIQNNERLSRDVQRNINKMAVIRSDLLTLFDHKMDRLTDYMIADGTINAIQKTVETVEFTGDLFQDGYVQESVANLILNRTLLIHSVTEEGPSLVVMRDECIDGSEVSKIISPYVTVNTTLLLIHGNKVLKSNKEIDKSNDVIFYAVINRLVDVTIINELGKGAYSTVCECTVGSSENRLAIKKHRNDGDLQRFIRDEIVAVSGIGRHSRIMKYHRFYENAEGFYILMDSMTESLSNHVKRLYPLKESQIMNFTKQILEGLSYLHKQMVAHWDLKGSNVLLSNTGEIKLSDFGNPKFQIVQKLYKKGQLSSLEPGIVNWMAPEVIMAESRLDKFKADVWSLGATLVEIVTGMPPMYDRDPASIVTQLCNAKKIEYEFPPQYSESLRKFMDKCLISDFNTRPYCHDLPSINIT